MNSVPLTLKSEIDWVQYGPYGLLTFVSVSENERDVYVPGISGSVAISDRYARGHRRTTVIQSYGILS